MKTFTFVVLVGMSVALAGSAFSQEPQEAAPAQQPVVQQQAPPPFTPSDPRLQQIVQLVQAGLSESLIAESIQKERVQYNLTPQDLLYLKQNRVPESIIAALLAVEAPTSPGPGRQAAVPEATPTVAPSTDKAIEGLILKTGTFRKNLPGTLVFLDDTVEWRDAADATGNLTIYPAGVKKVEVKCRAQATGPFCYEFEIDVSKGDSFKFEDAEQAVGGNRAVLALRDAWKEKFPRIPLTEKVKK